MAVRKKAALITSQFYFLVMQGTSTPAERVFSDMGTVLSKKRLAMTEENFEMLMFLSDCV